MDINKVVNEALAAFANTLLREIQEQLVPFEERLMKLEKNIMLNENEVAIRIAELIRPKMKDTIKDIVSDELDDYDPTTHQDFDNAVKDLVKEMREEVIRDFIQNKVTVQLNID